MSWGHQHMGLESASREFGSGVGHPQPAQAPPLNSSWLPTWNLGQGDRTAQPPPPPMDARVAAKMELAAYYDALSQQLPDASGMTSTGAPAPQAQSHGLAHTSSLSLQQLLASMQQQQHPQHQPQQQLLSHQLQHHYQQPSQMLQSGLTGQSATQDLSSLLWSGLGSKNGYWPNPNFPAAAAAAPAAVGGGHGFGLLAGSGGMPASTQAPGLGAYPTAPPTATATPLLSDAQPQLSVRAVKSDGQSSSQAKPDSSSNGGTTFVIPLPMITTGQERKAGSTDAPAAAEPPATAASRGADDGPPPRRVGRKPKLVTFESIAQRFDQPIERAARSLGVCTTVIKKVCRANGVQRWPYRKIQSVVRPIMQLQLRVAQGIASPDEIAELQRLTRAQQREQQQGGGSDADPNERASGGGGDSRDGGDSEGDAPSLPGGKGSPGPSGPSLHVELQLPAIPQMTQPRVEPQVVPQFPPMPAIASSIPLADPLAAARQYGGAHMPVSAPVSLGYQQPSSQGQYSPLSSAQWAQLQALIAQQQQQQHHHHHHHTQQQPQPQPSAYDYYGLPRALSFS